MHRSVAQHALRAFVAVVGYIHFAEWFFYMEEGLIAGNDAAIPACTSLLQCFITIFDDGLRANDVGAFIEPIRSVDIEDITPPINVFKFYAQSIYSLIFWFVVCIILLNVIFGIIIDSFSELRLQRQMIHDKMANECFICGIDRFTLDTLGGGFDNHREKEHEKWTYLFMLVMLAEKDPSEYNGWEQHVAQHVSPPSAAFMPRNTALSLKEHKDREEADVKKQQDQVAHTARVIDGMSSMMHAFNQRQDEMDKRMAKLAAAQLGEPSALRRRRSVEAPSPQAAFAPRRAFERGAEVRAPSAPEEGGGGGEGSGGGGGEGGGGSRP
jgi:hypothetical protein